MLYEKMIEREYRRALKVPLIKLCCEDVVLFRADTLDAGVKTPIGPCLVAHYIDCGLLTSRTKAVVVHGSGNTVRSVKAAIDELFPGKCVIAIVYAEIGGETRKSLSAAGIEVIAESPRSQGQLGRQSFAKQICRENRWLLIEQHEQPLILDIQRRTFGRAIVELLRKVQVMGDFRQRVDFVTGVGTGGTLFGIGAALQKAYSETRMIAIEGVGSILTLWHAYLGVKGKGYEAEKAAIERLLTKYEEAGMIVSLKSHPHRKDPERWFDIDIDFPTTSAGVVGIESLGVGDPSNLIRDHLLEVDEVQIVTDKQATEGVQLLKFQGIYAAESAGANFFAAMQQAKKLHRSGKGGPIVTIITAKK